MIAIAEKAMVFQEKIISLENQEAILLWALEGSREKKSAAEEHMKFGGEVP